MLSVLTVERAGVNKDLAYQTHTMEMFHSSPEGEDLAPLVSIFIHKHPHWETHHIDEDLAVLRDSGGDYWIAQSVVHQEICIVDYNC